MVPIAAGSVVRIRQIPASPKRARGEAGFTLMELLVVMLIIGIIATFAVFTIPRDHKDLVLEEANRLKTLIQMASDEAVMQTAQFALQFHKDGYRFLRLQTDDEKGKWNWVPIEGDPVFRSRCLDESIKMEVSLEGVETDLVSMKCANGVPEDELAGNDKSDGNEPDSLVNKEEPVYPRVFLLSSGEMTPFEVDLPVEGSDGKFRIVGQIQGSLKLYYPGEEDDEES